MDAPIITTAEVDFGLPASDEAAEELIEAWLAEYDPNELPDLKTVLFYWERPDGTRAGRRIALGS